MDKRAGHKPPLAVVTPGALRRSCTGALIQRSPLGGHQLLPFGAIVGPVQTNAAGLVVVNIKGIVPDLTALVIAAGGQVVSQFPANGAVRARMPLQNVATTLIWGFTGNQRSLPETFIS